MLAKEFMKEAETMSKLRHENIVCIIGVSIQEEPFWIVTELLGNGDLLSWLKKKNDEEETMPFQGTVCLNIDCGSLSSPARLL